MTNPPSDTFRLDGKIAAITGAGSGIGRAIAELFAARGAAIAVLEVDEAAGRTAAEELQASGATAEFVACDVTDSAAVKLAFDAVKARFARLDVLVNNAGIGHVGNVENTTEEDFDRLFAVNVKGVYLSTQQALPLLLESGGVICNLASIASLIGIADRFAYSMTKGAVLTMTKSVAIDYMGRVRCNCICPARIHTPFVDGYLAKNYPGREQEMFDQLAAYQPMGRMGTPTEVAEMALFLCSPASAFVTGQAFPLDGGVLCV
ncbi:MAG: SDR family oxidoreductase [bacterium]|nr:SDR family oxidoreductase [bacterium]